MNFIKLARNGFPLRPKLLAKPFPSIFARHYSVFEPPLTCTIFNAAGRVESVAAQIPKKTFLREYGLHSRDLRHIDGKHALVPRILVHQGTILVNITDLRVLIRRDRVLVFDSKDPKVAERLSMLVYDFQAKLAGVGSQKESEAKTSQVYEQRALETVLVHAIAYLEVELNRQLSTVEGVLEDLESHVERSMLYELLVGAKGIDAFHRKALAVRNALDDALDDDDGVAKMYLTDPAGPGDSDYHDIELLLETYYTQADELVQKAGLTSRDVATTGEIVNMMIDSNRNSLMLFRLRTSIATVSFAVALFVADLYGMNLENWIEETDWGMLLVSVTCILTAVVGTRYNFRRLEQARQVHMSGIVPHLDGGEKTKMWRWLESSKHTPNNSTVRSSANVNASAAAHSRSKSRPRFNR